MMRVLYIYLLKINYLILTSIDKRLLHNSSIAMVYFLPILSISTREIIMPGNSAKVVHNRWL